MNHLNQSVIETIHLNSESEPNDMYHQMDNHNHLYQANVNGTEFLYVGSSYASPLVDIDKFVHKVLDTKDLAFDITKTEDSAFIVKKLYLSKYYNFILAYQACYSDVYWYSEHVELFFKCVNSLGLWGYPFSKPNRVTTPSGKPDGQLFNELITLIREQSKKPEFLYKVERRIKNSEGNYGSAKSYIDALFKKYSSLLVIRINPGYIAEVGKTVTIKQAQRHLRKFLNNWRSNKLFENCVGYIWKMEMGDTKGFHFHIALFFNGNKHRKDEFLGLEISQYWDRVITKGTGHCINSNQLKKKYRAMNLNIGIGMIENYDFTKRGYLLDNIRYITKTDQYIKLKNSPKTRTFGRGAMPEIPKIPLGRPRTKLPYEDLPNDSANPSDDPTIEKI